MPPVSAINDLLFIQSGVVEAFISKCIVALAIAPKQQIRIYDESLPLILVLLIKTNEI